MIKKQKKWIAVLVALAFVWLLQVSSMPLGAAGAKEEVTAAGSEQGPDFLEVTSYKPAPAKKSIVPYLLIGLGVAAVAAVLVLVVFKTKYDVRGTWSVTAHWSGLPVSPAFPVVFSGSSKESGTFVESGTWNGTFTASGKNVTWVYLSHPELNMTFMGTFTGKDEMSGTMTMINPAGSGTFTAVRTAAATSISNAGPGGRKDIK